MREKILISHREECPNCKGTGLYIGFAERDGYAVVCHTCKGTGEHHFQREYFPFKGKNPPPESVTTVLQINPGIQTGKKSGVNFGGMPIQDWAKGKTFKRGMEMRQTTCPAWWYQIADYDKKPNYDECIWGGSFTGCKMFDRKHLCWERFDRENKSSP